MNDNITHKNIGKVFLAISLIYNFMIGFFSFMIYLFISWTMINYKNYIELLLILIFIILLIPFNILIKIKSKENTILYIALNVLAYTIGYLLYILAI